jgi:uncharacterized protein YqhQ
MLPALESGQEELLVGGQAVMEGVMMRAPHSFAVAVRQPGGTIAVHSEAIARPSEKHKWLKYPILRGLGTLGQSLWLGIRALRYSAACALGTEQGGDSKAAKVSNWVLTANILFSVGFFIAFYKLLPLLLTTEIQHFLPMLNSQFMFNLVDGLIRMALFLGFLTAVSRWKEIRRVYEYHGAEHKTVYNFESGKTVSIENARAFSRLHPRCGTSFLLVVMFMSLVMFLFIPLSSLWLRLAMRVVLLPVVAGLSYEVIRFSAKRGGFVWAQLIKPGLLLQRVTTQDPSDPQLETAVRALDEAMALEAAQGGELVIA